MDNLKNKVAYITGGSKGIGLGVAQVLLDAGLRVAISGRHADSLKAAAAHLHSDNVMTVVSDVSHPENEEDAVKKILAHWGQLDVVLANAA